MVRIYFHFISVSAFIDLWKDVSSRNDESTKEFFNSIGLLDHDGNNFLHLKILFENICKRGLQMRDEIKDTDSVNKMDRDVGL